MRINVEIDDALLAEAMEALGQKTKRATVEEALKTLVRLRDDYRAIRKIEQSRAGDDPKILRRERKA